MKNNTVQVQARQLAEQAKQLAEKRLREDDTISQDPPSEVVDGIKFSMIIIEHGRHQVIADIPSEIVYAKLGRDALEVIVHAELGGDALEVPSLTNFMLAAFDKTAMAKKYGLSSKYSEHEYSDPNTDDSLYVDIWWPAED